MTGRLSFGSIHGKELRRADVAGFSLQEWDYDADFQFPRHSHDSAFFNLLLHGCFTETCGNWARTCPPFTLIFQPAGEPHGKQIHRSGARTFDVEISPRWLERVRDHGLRLDSPIEVHSGLPIWLALRLYKEFDRLDEVSPLTMEGLAIELLAEVLRPPVLVMERQPPRWLREARDLLHARFAESLSLDEIARAVGVHPDHLARGFRQQFRRTVGDYVRQLRLDFVCHQLATSDTPLVEIALAAGFADQSHLTNMFKRRTGMTPAQFRTHFRPCRLDTTR
jgi:AraC family transcriptional regulator